MFISPELKSYVNTFLCILLSITGHEENIGHKASITSSHLKTFLNKWKKHEEYMAPEFDKQKSEAATQKCSYEKVFWKYPSNYRRTPMPKCDFNKVALQENTHVEVWFK